MFTEVLILLVVASNAAQQCTSEMDCSLNGLCLNSQCICDAPWGGLQCSQLEYSVTLASAKSIYNNSDPRNTWGGPLVGPGSDGKYHAFIPLYEIGSLQHGHVETTLHGIADSPTGPWDFNLLPNISSTSINPQFLAFKNSSSGETFVSLWVDGGVLLSNSLYGPFIPHMGLGLYQTNPAPIYVNKTFYSTSQFTTEVYVASELQGPWSIFANISHPATLPYHVEDPFMWIDRRGHWHIINHAYNLSEFTDCSASHVSSHFFSEDGKNWHWSDRPYSHVVQYDDGSEKTFATLERPNLLFNSYGQPTYLTVAVDLEASNNCSNVQQCCACCKAGDHSGTAVIKLAV